MLDVERQVANRLFNNETKRLNELLSSFLVIKRSYALKKRNKKICAGTDRPWRARQGALLGARPLRGRRGRLRLRPELVLPRRGPLRRGPRARADVCVPPPTIPRN